MATVDQEQRINSKSGEQELIPNEQEERINFKSMEQEGFINSTSNEQDESLEASSNDLDEQIDSNSNDNETLSNRDSDSSSRAGSATSEQMVVIPDNHHFVEEPTEIAYSSTSSPGSVSGNSTTSSGSPSKDKGRIPTSSLLSNPDGPLDDVRQLKELAQRKNLIYIGIPAIVGVPSTRVKEVTRGVFHIYNPTPNAITWSLVPTASAYWKRVETKGNNMGQKVADPIFVVMKERGFLRSGQSERVDINFAPLSVGIYTQKFLFGESEPGRAPTLGENNTVELQIEGKGWPEGPEKRKETRKREVQFEVEEKELKFPATRIGKKRALGIKIENPTKEAIRLRSKCEVVGATLNGPPVLSIPYTSLTVKSNSFFILPVFFQPRKRGTINGIVTLSSPVGKNEVKVDVIAQAVSANLKGGLSARGNAKSPTPSEMSSLDTRFEEMSSAESSKVATRNGTDVESNSGHSETSSIIDGHTGGEGLNISLAGGKLERILESIDDYNKNGECSSGGDGNLYVSDNSSDNTKVEEL